MNREREGERENGGVGEGGPSRRVPLSLLSLLSLLSCSSEGPLDVQTAARVPLRLDKPDAERLARYYLGGYAAPGGADPFAAGLVEGSGDDLTLRPQALDARHRAALHDADGDGAIGWDEFVAFVDATYYAARGLPETLDGLRAEAGAWAADNPAWFGFEVRGSAMTTAPRRTLVPTAAVRSALEGYVAAGERLVYPAGTLLVGEHLGGDGRVAETTVKRRRADGFWDFAVYDADGRLARATVPAPNPLRAPTQCVGCHLGRRTFEPEKRFPAASPDGPFGERAVVVPQAWRNADVAGRFEEHARRSDGVLGLYATLYASKLAAERAAGTATADDAALLDALGLGD